GCIRATKTKALEGPRALSESGRGSRAKGRIGDQGSRWLVPERYKEPWNVQGSLDDPQLMSDKPTTLRGATLLRAVADCALVRSRARRVAIRPPPTDALGEHAHSLAFAPVRNCSDCDYRHDQQPDQNQPDQDRF